MIKLVCKKCRGLTVLNINIKFANGSKLVSYCRHCNAKIEYKHRTKEVKTEPVSDENNKN